MAKTNHERVGDALNLLKQGLKPFVEREFQASYGDGWKDQVLEYFPASAYDEINWDAAAILRVMWTAWNDVFRRTLGHAERSLVSELRDVRNKWAHQKAFSTEDAYRAMDSASRLLSAVSAPQAEELDRQKNALLRIRFDEQRRNEMRKQTLGSVEGRPRMGLKPWREVVTPHRDVASGNYQQAEFAADLWQVYLGEATSEYQHPTEFFRELNDLCIYTKRCIVEFGKSNKEYYPFSLCIFFG